MIRLREWYFAAALLTVTGCGTPNQQDASATSSASAGAGAGAGTVLAKSRYDDGPRAAESEIDEALVPAGEKLFSAKGCTACHAFGKKATGPDLAGVSSRRTARWMENQILHPDVMVKEDPIAHQLFAQFMLQMPNQGLTPEEAKAVIEYFKHRDHEAGEKH